MPELIYAYVHVPKTAGTTLIHLLRRNFLLRCMDVRPFSQSSEGIFSAKDLAISLRINPLLQCITGHSVRAISDLESVVPNVKYFTILRDPVKRFISAYLYLNDVMKQGLPFEKHLMSEGKQNLQTRWIAGTANLDAAISLLETKFFLVGRTESLNQFVLLLARSLRMHGFDPVYRSRNMAASRGEHKREIATRLEERYGDDIKERNRLDIDVLAYVENNIMPRQRDTYGAAFVNDLATLEHSVDSSRSPTLHPYLDFAIRKLYYDPVIGAIRLMNGLQYRGSF